MNLSQPFCVLSFMQSFLLLAALGLAQDLTQWEAHGVKLGRTEYRGKPALQVLALPGIPNGESYAVLRGSDFGDGVLEVELAGLPGAGASATARGFVGLAFRLADGRFEYIYLRPTNGRAEDQVRRNHSTQYSSHPDYDFARLRREEPEKYESYVDLEPGAWTRVKIEVKGDQARLYVHGAAQPCLIVNGLKLGARRGAVALWVGPGTEAYFTNLQVRSGN